LTKTEQQKKQRIKDNLAAEGYETPNLLGKPFNQGMKIVPVSTIADETLLEGEEIITTVMTPQINKDDKMIQAAHVIVTVGTNPNGISAKEFIEKKAQTKTTATPTVPTTE